MITNVSFTSPYTDINECNEAERKAEDLCGPKGSCKNINGSYWCKCQKGYTNYGHERTPCSGECMHTRLIQCIHGSLNKLPDTDVVCCCHILLSSQKYTTVCKTVSSALWCSFLHLCSSARSPYLVCFLC